MKFSEKLVKAIKGENVEDKAKKMQRKAKVLLKISISDAENEILKKEEELEKCKENYEMALVNYCNTELDDESYIFNIITTKNRITEAEEDLDNSKATLDFLKSLSKEISE